MKRRKSGVWALRVRNSAASKWPALVRRSPPAKPRLSARLAPSCPSRDQPLVGDSERRTLKCASGPRGGFNEMSLRSGPASEIRVDDMSCAIGQSGDYVWRPTVKPQSISECALHHHSRLHTHETSPRAATLGERPDDLFSFLFFPFFIFLMMTTREGKETRTRLPRRRCTQVVRISSRTGLAKEVI